MISSLRYTFSRSRSLATPFFSDKTNVEGALGITGASTAPINWGPPNLSFTSGINGLSDGAATLSRNQTSAVGESLIFVHNTHNFTFGGDFRRQQINPLSDANARGAFTFTGQTTSQIVNGVAASGTGSDFADFLLGRPDTSSLQYGNPDKYFRTNWYDVYMTDDWRLSTKLSLNMGLRWDYTAPITELYNRIVNLDIAPGFTAIAPVLPGQTGKLSGTSYPSSLVNPDKRGIAPRIGFAWRPFPKHSTVVRGGYGIYYNTSIYGTIANNLAAQPPFAQTLSVASSAANPLTLQNGFVFPLNTVTNTRAIDPNYRIGYPMIWQLSVQNDLGHAPGGDHHPAPHQRHAAGSAVSAGLPAARIARHRDRPRRLYLRTVERQFQHERGGLPVAAAVPQRDFGQRDLQLLEIHRRCLHPGRRGGGAELATADRRARAFPVRCAAHADRDMAVQHRRGHQRRNPGERL